MHQIPNPRIRSRIPDPGSGSRVPDPGSRVRAPDRRPRGHRLSWRAWVCGAPGDGEAAEIAIACHLRPVCQCSRKSSKTIFVPDSRPRLKRRRRLPRSDHCVLRITRTCSSIRPSGATRWRRHSRPMTGAGRTTVPSSSRNAGAGRHWWTTCVMSLNERRSLVPHGCASARPSSRRAAMTRPRKRGRRRAICLPRRRRRHHPVT